MGAMARRTIDAAVRSAAACALVMALTSCGGTPTPSVPSPSSSTSPSTPSPSAIDSPSPIPSPTASAVAAYELGTEAITPRGSRMTVFGISPGKHYRRPFKDYTWLAADIQFCLRASIQQIVPIQDIRAEFALELDDGKRSGPDISAAAAAETFSAAGRTIAADECVRAPVVFGVRTDATVVYVMLVSPLGMMRWRAN